MTDPVVGPGVTLYLRGRVATSQAALTSFLTRARVVYEEPGGIRTRLQWNLEDPAEFVEIIEYADRTAFETDQIRIEQDQRMQDLLSEWRSHLAGPPRVIAYQEQPI